MKTSNIDLFFHLETLSTDVSKIIDRFNKRESLGQDPYANCEKLVEELKIEGYTCEYGLDGVPFNLRKL